MFTRSILFPLICLLALLSLGGCADINLARAEAVAESTATAADLVDRQIAALQAELDTARAIVERFDSELARQAVAVLESSLAVAQERAPQVRQIAIDSQARLAELRAMGSDHLPWWKVGLALLVPVALPFLKTIPKVGPLIGGIGEMLWRAYATREQQAAQARIEAEAKALPHQVAVANLALAKVDAATAKSITAKAKAQQIEAGVHDAIVPHVAHLEAAAA